MMNALVIFFRFIFRHKFKIILTFFLSLFFFVFLFPLSDLNDYISAQVSKYTGNTIFLQFDKLSLQPLNAALNFDKVYVEAPAVSALTAEELLISPSLPALLARQPGGTLTAKGFLNGELQISLVPGPQSASGAARSKINLTASQISLKSVREVAGMSLPIKGELNFTGQALADMALAEQPELDLTLLINRFELPASSMSLQDFGLINLPEIKLSRVELKGRLAGGKFQIENGKLGAEKDDFFGDIKGDMNISFQNMGGQVVPIFGAYDISLDLRASPAFQEKAKFFLSFLDGYRSESATGTHYKFKIQAASQGMPPQFAPLR